MKTEENLARTGLALQFHNPHGILLASDVFQTGASGFMPARTQPLGISISLVQNDPQTSQVLCDWIRPAHGFSVVNYHKNADSALAALPNEKPSIVLMELHLAGIDASKYIRRLKPALQQTQFVILMVDGYPDHVFDALAAGATGYVLPQIPRAGLVAALKHIHAGGSPMSGGIAKKVLQSFQYPSPANAAAELSPRENRILRLLSRGSSCEEAAETLNIGLPMVSTFIRSIYEKLHLHSAAKF